MTNPKLFISYSWSSPQHEQWVIQLSTELRESGVDVILDKWDLKEGHDAIVFMEKMVSDPEVRKVIMVCDETYARKSDGRAGGVGTESQIISKEVYDNISQDKFVAVVTQKDENGKPYVPTYYKSRIHIDLSEPDSYAQNFEQLLRWIFDKPLHTKPEIGKPPSFLADEVKISLGITIQFKRTLDAIKNHRPTALGALDEYFSAFTENLERYRIIRDNQEFDDLLVANIDQFISYRNEAIQIFTAISQYSTDQDYLGRTHRFFENLIPYMSRPQSVSQSNDYEYDNFKFLAHELFLYALAVFIRQERFDAARVLLEQQYYVPGNSDYGRNELVSFTVFRQYVQSLEVRNKRLDSRRLSLRADLLKERNLGSGIEFRYLMQADFIAYLRAELQDVGDYDNWWPETLLYLGRFHGAFEVFARAVSLSYFDRIKHMLGIQKPEDLAALLASFKDGSRRLPSWNFTRFDPASLLGFENLGGRP